MPKPMKSIIEIKGSFPGAVQRLKQRGYVSNPRDRKERLYNKGGPGRRSIASIIRGGISSNTYKPTRKIRKIRRGG